MPCVKNTQLSHMTLKSVVNKFTGGVGRGGEMAETEYRIRVWVVGLGVQWGIRILWKHWGEEKEMSESKKTELRRS